MKARLGELAQKFVSRTREDLRRMHECLVRLDAGENASVDEIRQLAHRIAGTGGTLGMISLSDAASDLERVIDAMPADDAPDASMRAQVAAGVERLAALLALS